MWCDSSLKSDFIEYGGVIMKCEWKYFIVLNSDDRLNNIVDGSEDEL